ncbi:acyl-CoA dehydrogenase family protein [Alcaligenaceae bacterium CGII-47]|nr:acyl-CoA dehydrogenase family protein [Alcaligenaceae bacterium CGII-47]
MILTNEQEMVRDTAREFAKKEIAPYAQEWERDGVVPTHILKHLGELGLMGICVDERWGGAGADFVSYILATVELAGADCGVCNMMNVHNSPVCSALSRYGTDEQNERMLQPLSQGKLFGALLLTEPDAGSDASAIKTRAIKKGNKYILNGTKQFVTSGQTANVAMILAVTDPSKGSKGITCFVTSTDNPGYKVSRIEEKMGHRNCDTCQIVLDDMEVPVEDVLGQVGEGYKIILSFLTPGRIAIAAQAVGVARAALEATLVYAQERKTFGKPLIEHQSIAFRLADMATQVRIARTALLQVAHDQETGRIDPTDASMIKVFASEMAENVCSAAVQIHGGYGYLTDYPVEKYYRDARVLQIYEGSSEVQKILISRSLVKNGAKYL